jgi:hypothetical protein
VETLNTIRREHFERKAFTDGTETERQIPVTAAASILRAHLMAKAQRGAPDVPEGIGVAPISLGDRLNRAFAL